MTNIINALKIYPQTAPIKAALKDLGCYTVHRHVLLNNKSVWLSVPYSKQHIQCVMLWIKFDFRLILIKAVLILNFHCPLGLGNRKMVGSTIKFNLKLQYHFTPRGLGNTV